MLKTLIKKQLLELFHTYFIDRKTGKARSKGKMAGIVILALFLFGSLGAVFFGMSMGVGSVMLGTDLSPVYFGLMALISIALGVFGSVFTTYASLYLPKDNEALLCLPIPPSKLLIARTAGVYITSFIYSALGWIPAVIASWILGPVSVAGVVFPVLLTFVIALFVTVLSCVLGWGVALVAVKVKGKSIVNVIMSVAFLAVYYVVYFKVINSLEDIMEHIDAITNTVSKLHFILLIGRAADGGALSLLIVAAITAALAAAGLFILSKTFLKFAFAANKESGKKTKTEGVRQRSLKKALLMREYRHFTSTSAWMLNGGLGLLLLPGAGVAALIKRTVIREALGQMTEGLPMLSAALPVLVFGAVGLILSTNTLTAASVSLEGKNLWIVQSLPVDPWELLRAKERMDVQLNVVPTAAAVVLMGIAFGMTIPEIALLLCALLFAIPLHADIGLILDLKRPNLNWTNPAIPIKQNFSVTVALFGSWLGFAAFTAAGFFAAQAIGSVITLGIMIPVIAGVWLLLRRWLKNRGGAILASL